MDKSKANLSGIFNFGYPRHFMSHGGQICFIVFFVIFLGWGIASASFIKCRNLGPHPFHGCYHIKMA